MDNVSANKVLNQNLEVNTEVLKNFINNIAPIINNIAQGARVIAESPFMQGVMAFGALLQKVQESPEMQAFAKVHVEFCKSISKMDPGIFEQMNRPLISNRYTYK